ncbi:MAG: APC family permease [Candidatus Aminicenantes bacterium]|nr:APC family permease [Candidatus Aminicenantes bacterium]
MTQNGSDDNNSLMKKVRQTVVGAPRNIKDPSIFHKLSLVPLLAWIGLGADGLSSSSYGPEEAFRALGQHTYLAIFLALATSLTVFIISYSYSRIIEHFPHGGGGYIVATHTLGPKSGVVSGSALLVDYMLTITVSIAACGDAIFSFLPIAWHPYKIFFELLLILLLIVLNLRGVKESVTILAPIFIVFVITHVFMIGYGILSHLPQIGPVVHGIKTDFNSGLSTLGGLGMLALFLRAYSLGAGTYTGIEAVANGMQILREPKVQTGKKTMLYMAVSLAFTASGLFFCYLFLKVTPGQGKTLNAILASALYGDWSIGYGLALVTILSEGALLFVAAQAGFIDGPRIMANMAIDSWLPHRFASLSQRLTMHNGILLMGGASILLLFYTRGSISSLVTMYAINVFLTFSISQLGMSKYYIQNRRREREWKKHLPVHLVGFALCFTILGVTVRLKFLEGGWMTLLITGTLVTFCYLIRRHYARVKNAVRKLDDLLLDIPTQRRANLEKPNPQEMTAIQLVSEYNGFGVHTVLSVIRNFPNLYKNFIFASVAVVDSGSFKGAEEMKNLEEAAKATLQRYVDLTRRLGFAADWRYAVGTDVVEAATQLCKDIKKEFPRSTVFTGKLAFRREKFYHKMLHNETAFAIQRQLHWDEITSVTLPIRLDL